MIWSIISFISVFIIVFLIMEISPRFFPIIEKNWGLIYIMEEMHFIKKVLV